MRIRPQPTREQRKALRAALVRMQQPEVALEVVRPCLARGFEVAGAACDLQSVHPDRFVLRVRVRATTGEEASWALKAYADDYGREIWEFARAVARRHPSNHIGLCLPLRHVPEEQALVFPWVEGTRLSEIVDERKPVLLRGAAALAADIHRTHLDALPMLTPAMVVADALERCARLWHLWPAMEATLSPLTRFIQDAASELEPARMTVIHGDMAAGQFLWTGDRLVLLDIDTVGRADPAYDVGHFLGQLERRCTLDTSLPWHAEGWLACFRDAYAATGPPVSWRNVAFYQGLTLVRKMFTLAGREPVEGPRLAALLAERARAAFECAGPSTWQEALAGRIRRTG